MSRSHEQRPRCPLVIIKPFLHNTSYLNFSWDDLAIFKLASQIHLIFIVLMYVLKKSTAFALTVSQNDFEEVTRHFASDQGGVTSFCFPVSLDWPALFLLPFAHTCFLDCLSETLLLFHTIVSYFIPLLDCHQSFQEAASRHFSEDFTYLEHWKDYALLLRQEKSFVLTPVY